MNVYYNGNGPAWGKGKRGQKLTAFPLQKTFLWEDQEIYLPAIYARTSGVILDVCTKVPLEKMHHFLKKWPKKRRLSINGLEDFEKIEADNPCSIDFSADMRLDNKLLKNTVRSSLIWHPDEILRMEKEIMQTEWNNDSSADQMMETYKLDPSFCWHFCRLVLAWNDKPVLPFQKISLTFHEEPVPVTAAHFSTTPVCREDSVTVIHPQTRQTYVLTLHELCQTALDFDFGEKNMDYPKLFQTLSYSISPETDLNSISILDCAKSDPPKKLRNASASGNTSAIAVSPISAAGTDPVPKRLSACSSCHFKPVETIEWRVVFQIKKREDITLNFELHDR